MHEVAQQANQAARVAYVDVDPVAIGHSKALLAGNENTAVIQADLRNQEKILSAAPPAPDRFHPAGRAAARAVLHFIDDAEDPWQIVATLRDALPPGAIWPWATPPPRATLPWPRPLETVYNRSVSTQVHVRSRDEILRFFDGFELLDPGLVYIPQWRPDSPADPPGDPSKFWGELVGVARKP